MSDFLITLRPDSCIHAAARPAATRRYLAGMQQATDLLAEAIGQIPKSGLSSEQHHETSCRTIAPHLLVEARHLDEDLVITALARFCTRDLGRLLAEHGHNPVVCAKVLRANFHRLLRWRQRDLWRRDNRRRVAEENFTVAQVREAYEGGCEWAASAVLAEATALDPEIARLIPADGEARSLGELHGKLAAALHCSKATARRRLLALGQRLRALMRRETGRFLAERPASHLPAGTGACATRVIRSVCANA